ncbi:MAG: GIY-YIG nuclease family protein, partial [Ignavibacterium sp.]|nr:GIY-YIG nuclease family protein [Ignavibacterium sp.]
RLKEHNSGKSKFTKKYMPWELLYYEEFESQSEAITKEKYFKTTSGRRLIKKLISPGSSVGYLPDGKAGRSSFLRFCRLMFTYYEVN